MSLLCNHNPSVVEYFYADYALQAIIAQKYQFRRIYQEAANDSLMPVSNLLAYLYIVYYND